MMSPWERWWRLRARPWLQRTWPRRWLVRASCALMVIFASFHIAVCAGEYPDAYLRPSEASSLVIRDRHGQILRQEMSSAGLRESWIDLEAISPHLVHATLASEDSDFWSHNGVSWMALGRAAWLNLRGGRLAFGGSTITMQLTRLTAKTERSLLGKLEQSVLASRLERKLSKTEILEHYMNRIYYGNGAWGAEQAARRYFGKSAARLSAGEAALLAVFPRGPEFYDPFRHWHRALERRDHILGLMHKRGYLSAEERDLGRRAPIAISRSPRAFRAPHFAELVKAQLPDPFSRATEVETTLDLPLQERVELEVGRHVDAMRHRNLTQAAAVVVRNADGAILAMVGSVDYFDQERSGAYNGATARLRPGSTLKPFVYGAAMEAGDTPATLAYDVALPEDAHQFYTKDVRQHGFARYREALAGSYNLSAVHALQRVGLPTALRKLREAGLRTLDREDGEYDWGLAIGHAEVTLLDLVGAFTSFGRGGTAVRPRAIAHARSVDGREFAQRVEVSAPIFSEEISYQLYDILSDPDARKPMFGDRVPMNLGFKVALKTGTTKAYTDLWAVGVTSEYTVGVWAGNFDGSPTHQVMSVEGATPLVRAIYTAVASRYGEPTEPPRPASLIEAPICPTSGKRPGPHCPHRKTELFSVGSAPDETCSWHQRICDQDVVVFPPELRPWADFYGRTETPACPSAADLPQEASDPDVEPLRILSPFDGARYALEPHRAAHLQRPPLAASPAGSEVQWLIDGVHAEQWVPSRGSHTVRLERGAQSDEVTIAYE